MNSTVSMVGLNMYTTVNDMHEYFDECMNTGGSD